MADDELFDVYDEQMNRTGTATRREVHAGGFWHRTFQCWIYSVEEGVPYLLFQKRHPAKETFPDLLDISCAGHLLAGEQVEDGVRELAEELGLEVPFERLTPCGVFAEEDFLPNGLIDREFCHVFVYECGQPLSAYRMQPEEVAGLYRIRLDDVRRLIYGLADAVPATGVSLNPDGELHELSVTVRRDDLVPHSPAYYELVFKWFQNKKRPAAL
jgi:isopentenyldiphosphate isomerase